MIKKVAVTEEEGAKELVKKDALLLHLPPSSPPAPRPSTFGVCKAAPLKFHL